MFDADEYLVPSSDACSLLASIFVGAWDGASFDAPLSKLRYDPACAALGNVLCAAWHGLARSFVQDSDSHHGSNMKILQGPTESRCVLDPVA